MTKYQSSRSLGWRFRPRVMQGRPDLGRPARMGRISRRILIPVIIAVVWWLVTASGSVNALFLPSPVDLLHSAGNMRGPLPQAIFTTLTMTLTGFGVGTGAGLILGLMMAYSRPIRELFGFVFDFLRPVPVFALIPLFILWFGIGRAPQVALIALGDSVILGVATTEAIRNVPQIFIRASLTLGAGRHQVYRTVIIPSIAPHLVGAIRVAAAASWGLDVAAEFIGSQSGLGYLMIQRESYLDTSGIVVIVAIYCLAALLFDRAIQVLEGQLLRWPERHQATGAAGALLGGR